MPTTLEPAELAERLRRSFGPRQVVAVLRELGISGEDFSLLTEVDQRTVRRWEAGAEPRPEARDAIDRLRVAVLYMLQRNAMSPSDIPHWLRSRNLEMDLDAELGVRRPLDAIRDDQLPDVFAAINAILYPLPSNAEDRLTTAEAAPDLLVEVKNEKRRTQQRVAALGAMHSDLVEHQLEPEVQGGDEDDEDENQRSTADSGFAHHGSGG